MVKSDLVKMLTERYPELPPQASELIVTLSFEAMADGLAAGESLEIRGFGSFKIKRQKPRWARNPRSGETVFQSSRNTIHFKPGKEIRERIQSPV